jgi:hypothetical protein
MPRQQAKQIAIDTTGLDRALTSADDDLAKALLTLNEAAAIIRRLNTTDATATAIYTFAIPNDTTVGITAEVSGKRTNGTGRIFYVRVGVAYREGAGAAAFEGSIQSPTSRRGPGNPGYDVTIDLSSNTLRVMVTGAAANDLSWTARIFLTVSP